MAEILRGGPVAAALNEKSAASAERLRQQGVIPTLAILRVGERPDDLSYEHGAMKRCAQVGVDVVNAVLPADVDSDTFFEKLEELNRDPGIHGILMFRPLPGTIDEERARNMILPEKDVDGCTNGSLAGVFINAEVGFPPCTAQAAMEILHFYNISVEGMYVAVVGRSLVIGRPVAMMLMHENATVTICHTRTPDVRVVTKAADLVIAASGQLESIDAEYFREGQIVIDVGIGWNEKKNKLCGDVLFEEAEPLAAAITPVPGGLGAVTTGVLVSHVVEAAERSLM